MSETANEARREYMRAWAAKNREARREYMRKWSKDNEARKEYIRKWQADNRDKMKANSARYWEKQAQKAGESEQAGQPA